MQANESVWYGAKITEALSELELFIVVINLLPWLPLTCSTEIAFDKRFPTKTCQQKANEVTDISTEYNIRLQLYKDTTSSSYCGK